MKYPLPFVLSASGVMRFYYCLFTAILLVCLAAAPARAQSPKDRHELDSLKPLLATLPQDTSRAKVLNRIAWLYFTSHQDSMRLYAQDAKRLAETLQYYRGVSIAMELLAHYYNNKLKLDQALTAYFENLRYNEEHGLSDLQGRVLERIGYVHYMGENFPLALDYMQRSLSVRQQFKDTSGIGKSYFGLAQIAYAMGDVEQGLRYLFQAKSIFEALHDEEYSITVLGIIGSHYLDRDDTKRARQYFMEALALSKRIGFVNKVNRNLLNISRTYLTERKYPESLSYLTQMIPSDELIDPYGERYKLYADIYAGMGDYKRALDYYRRYHEYNDSVKISMNKLRVLQLQADYVLENKEKEAAKDQQIQRMTIIGLSGGGFALIVMLALAINRFRVKERANQEIMRQQKVLEDQSVEIEISNTALHEKKSHHRTRPRFACPRARALRTAAPERPSCSHSRTHESG